MVTPMPTLQYYTTLVPEIFLIPLASLLPCLLSQLQWQLCCRQTPLNTQLQLIKKSARESTVHIMVLSISSVRVATADVPLLISPQVASITLISRSYCRQIHCFSDGSPMNSCQLHQSQGQVDPDYKDHCFQTLTHSSFNYSIVRTLWQLSVRNSLTGSLAAFHYVLIDLQQTPSFPPHANKLNYPGNIIIYYIIIIPTS